MPANSWKMPPFIKVYEALGAIGDGRVRIVDSRRALVTSSDGVKTYEVEVSEDGREISSNAKTLAEVDKELERRGHDPDAVRSEAEAVLTFLRKLGPVRGRRSRPPAETPLVKLRSR